MNTMNKWFVAGLIGLVSTGMAWAVPDLDLNATIWGDNVNPIDVHGGSAEYANYDGGMSSLIVGQSGSGNNEVIINNSALTWNFSKPATTGQGTGTAAYSIGAPFADYTGITIDFQNAVSSYFSARGTYYLRVSWYDIDWNPHTADYNLRTHSAGITSLAWTDNIWNIDGGGIGSISDMTVNIDYVTLVLGTGQNTIAASFTEQFNSIVLNGVADQGVPEPETVWMIVAVLASLAVTFRRQLVDLAGRFVKA